MSKEQFFYNPPSMPLSAVAAEGTRKPLVHDAAVNKAPSEGGGVPMGSASRWPFTEASFQRFQGLLPTLRQTSHLIEGMDLGMQGVRRIDTYRGPDGTVYVETSSNGGWSVDVFPAGHQKGTT